MKEKLTKNLGMRLLSLVIAAILWVIIINVDDPVDTKKFSSITVKVINEEAITSLGKVYEITSGNTVDVTVRAKRSILSSLKVADFYAVADLSKLSEVMATPIDVTITKASAQEAEIISYGKNHTLKVSLEDVIEKQFPITIMPKGTADDRYYLGETRTRPNIIQVSGAKSVVERIDQVRVEIDVSDATEDVYIKSEPQAYDSSGRKIESDKLTFSASEVSVSATLLPTKYVNLSVKTKGMPYSGYKVSSIDYEPKKIQIAGTLEDLQKVNSVEVGVSIANRISTLEESFNINDFLVKGVVVANDTPTVMVTVGIEKIQTKTITFRSEDVQIKNLPSHTTFHYDNNKEIEVNVSGLQKDIEDINKNSLQPYIDLSNLSYGMHTLKVEFTLEDEDVTIDTVPTIKITLSEIDEEDQPIVTSSPSPTPVDTISPPPDEDTGEDVTEEDKQN